MLHHWLLGANSVLAVLTLLLIPGSSVIAQPFTAVVCNSSSPHEHQDVGGTFGSIALRPGDNCRFHILPVASASNVVLHAVDLDVSKAEVWYCCSSDCGSSETEEMSREGSSVSLDASIYPDGVWIHISVPTITNTSSPASASLEFSWISNCNDESNKTPLLLYPTTDNGNGAAEAWPSYSLCVYKPNNDADFGIDFSWQWVFERLPPSFARGFYAFLPPFQMALPHGVYDVQLLPANSPYAQRPMEICLVLLARDGSELARFNKSVKGYFVPAVNNITFGSMLFYLPAGIGDQSAAVATFRYAPIAPPLASPAAPSHPRSPSPAPPVPLPPSPSQPPSSPSSGTSSPPAQFNPPSTSSSSPSRPSFPEFEAVLTVPLPPPVAHWPSPGATQQPHTSPAASPTYFGPSAVSPVQPVHGSLYSPPGTYGFGHPVLPVVAAPPKYSPFHIGSASLSPPKPAEGVTVSEGPYSPPHASPGVRALTSSPPQAAAPSSSSPLPLQSGDPLSSSGSRARGSDGSSVSVMSMIFPQGPVPSGAGSLDKIQILVGE